MEQIIFHVPPRNRGQIVEVSYAMVAEQVIRRTFDQSDRSMRYDISRMLNDDDGDYWNAAPKNKRWRHLSESEMRDIELEAAGA